VVLGKYFQKNRSQLKYSDLPKICASLSSDREDDVFEHSGIDGEEHYEPLQTLEQVVEQVLLATKQYSMVKVQSFCLLELYKSKRMDYCYSTRGNILRMKS
jgi:hypothetical protein